jgi:hypothetical protein
MIISAFEMIISVTNTIVKIGRRNNLSIRNRLSVIVDHGLCDGNDHFVDEEDGQSDEEDGRSDERDGRPHENRGPDDGNGLFCSEEDHLGCGSDLRRRKDHGMGDANHHR